MSFFKDKKLTLVLPFYNDGEDRMPLQVETWKSYPDWVWDNISIVLVDDCSVPTLETHYPKDNGINFNLSIYRVRDSLKYNLPGAYNLGFSVCDTEWVYGMDSDHMHTWDDFSTLLTELEVDDNAFYQCIRRRITNDPNRAYSNRRASGSWLMRKELWKQANGLDEELTGERSHSWGYWEHDFTYRLMALVPIKLPGKDEELPRIEILEYLPDYFGLDLNPHCDEDKQTNRRRAAYKRHGLKEHPTEMLRFAWHKVYGQRRV